MPNFDNGVDQLPVQMLPVGQRLLDNQKLLQNRSFPRRKCIAYLVSRIFRRCFTANPNQLPKGFPDPGRPVFRVAQANPDLPLRIVDQCGEILFFLLGEFVPERFVDPPFDGPGSTAQYMLEGFMLAVQVGNKMLRPLGQLQHGRKLDNLARCVPYGREMARQEPQVWFAGLQGGGRRGRGIGRRRYVFGHQMIDVRRFLGRHQVGLWVQVHFHQTEEKTIHTLVKISSERKIIARGHTCYFYFRVDG